MGGYIPFYTHNIGGKESIKNNDDEKPPKAKRSRGKRTGSGGCRFYKSTALGNFSDLALVRLYSDVLPYSQFFHKDLIFVFVSISKLAKLCQVMCLKYYTLRLTNIVMNSLSIKISNLAKF